MFIHVVFTPKFRRSLLREEIQEEVFRYISGIITQKGHKSIIVNGMPDHVHILTGFKPITSISDLVRDIKRSSALFINEKNLVPVKFQWQEGYGAFSCGYKDLDAVYNYIKNQKVHHQKASFRTEYVALLEENEIDYKTDHLFQFFE